jgi:hypothetical protein
MSANAVAAASSLLIVFGVLDLWRLNAGELPFALSDLLRPTLIVGAAVWAAGTLLLSVLRGRVFDVAVSLVAGLGAAAWMQANLLGMDLGELAGTTIRWESYMRQTLLNTAAWAGILLAPLVIRLVSKRLWLGLIWAVPALVSAMCLIGLTEGFSASAGQPPHPVSADKVVSIEGITDVSPAGNIYIFVLDMLDQRNVEAVQAAEPDLLASNLTGFTEFENYVSRFSKTQPSAINLLTGQDYFFDNSWARFTHDAYQQSDLLHQLRQAGYSTNIYATNRYSFAVPQDIEAVADNVAGAHQSIDQAAMIEGMIRLSALRYAPSLVKPSFWSDGSAFDRAVQVEDGPAPYVTDDIALYRSAKDGLVVTDGPPRFSFIHLNGSHPEYVMDRNAQPLAPGAEGNQVDQTIGAFKVVFAYLDELRRYGLYDNATVVIVGDHGNFTVEPGGELNRIPLNSPARTGLFVKLPGDSSTPLAHSMAQVTFANVRTAILNNAGLDSAEGAVNLFNVPEDRDIARPYYYRLAPAEGPALVEEWEVIGDASIWENWRMVREFATENN